MSRIANISTAKKPSKTHIVSICLAVFVVGAAVNLPIPLYGAYALLDGASERCFGLVFSAYALGVLPSLLFLGGLPDRIGRRPPLLAAILLSIGAVSLMSLLPGLTSLAVARVLQGLAVGLVGAPATAFLGDLLQGPHAAERAAACVTAMLPTGFAAGSLSTGLSLWFGPTLLPVSYLVLMTIGLISAALVTLVPDRHMRRPSPMLRLPFFADGARSLCLATGAIWSLVGTVSSIVPLELGLHGLPTWSGYSSFLMPFAGLVCRQPCRHLTPLTAARLSMVVAPVSSLVLAFGAAGNNLSFIMAGAVGAGVAGLGLGFYGGLGAVVALSQQEQARGSAAFFLSCYLGFCTAPAALGALADHMPMPSALMLLTVAITAVLVATSLVGARPPLGQAAGD